MKHSAKLFQEFLLEKWNTPLNGLELKDITSLTSYKNLSKYGLKDISSPLQRSRLNFRFSVLPDQVKDLGFKNKSGDFLKIFDVNQRSGRVQAYSHNNGGGNMLKSNNSPLNNIGDYDMMFRFIEEHIKRKISKDIPISIGNGFSRKHGSFKYYDQDPDRFDDQKEEYLDRKKSRKMDLKLNRDIDRLWQ